MGALLKVLSAQVESSASSTALVYALFCPGLPLNEAFHTYSGRRGAEHSEQLFTDPAEKPTSCTVMRGWLWKTKLLSPSGLQGAVDVTY